MVVAVVKLVLIDGAIIVLLVVSMAGVGAGEGIVLVPGPTTVLIAVVAIVLVTEMMVVLVTAAATVVDTRVLITSVEEDVTIAATLDDDIGTKVLVTA